VGGCAGGAGVGFGGAGERAAAPSAVLNMVVKGQALVNRSCILLRY
jgi:hypothetical protein